MNIDIMSLRTNMNAAVNNIEPSTKDMRRRYAGSDILSSISFSDMLEDALRNELIKESWWSPERESGHGGYAIAERDLYTKIFWKACPQDLWCTPHKWSLQRPQSRKWTDQEHHISFAGSCRGNNAGAVYTLKGLSGIHSRHFKSPEYVYHNMYILRAPPCSFLAFFLKSKDTENTLLSE